MIGIDLIKISRIEKFYKNFGDKAYKRFLNDDEIALVKSSKTAAGFWAAKEATSKALGVGISKECNFHDIIISKTPKGAPIIKLSQKVIKAFNIKDISLSITHDSDFAIAVVAIETKV